MEKRLVQFLNSENLNPTKFADMIGVQRSSISHILKGRNKPSYDFLIKVLETFPKLNAEWLLMGKGKMYKLDIPLQRTLFAEAENSTPTNDEISEKDEFIFKDSVVKSEENAVYRSKHDVEIDKIVIFYNNKTFKDYHSD